MKYKLLRFSLMGILAMFWGMVFAQEPAVTLDFTDQSKWDIPTSGTNTTLASFTDGTYTIKLCAADNYKLNNGYLIYGKNGSFLELPPFDFDVEKIEVVGRSGASGGVKQVLTNGQGALLNCDETTGAQGTNTYTLTGDDQKAGTYRILVTSAHNTQITKINVYKVDATDTRTATTMTLGEYVSTGEVGTTINLPTATVATATATLTGAEVSWESSNTDVATIGDGVINLLTVGTTTIKAIYAGDNTYKPCDANYNLTVTPAGVTISSFSELQAKCTSTTATPATITFNGELVVYVDGSNAYLADANGLGAMIYTSNHGLEAGQTLTGTIEAKIQLYQGAAEITGFSKEGLTIGTADVVPAEKTIGDITTAQQSTLVTLKNVTYNASSKTLTDARDNAITYYDKFKTNVALEDGKAYDVTGIVILYNQTIEICPRTADDVVAEEVDNRIETYFNLAFESYEGTVGETKELGVATVYSMDDDSEVAGSDKWTVADQTIAIYNADTRSLSFLKAGETTVTVKYDGSEEYQPCEASFALTVAEASVVEPEELANPYDYTFEGKVFDAKSQTKTLNAAAWELNVTCEDADGYFGYDNNANTNRGQQFGSSSKPATAVTLSTADIPGTITKIVVNTSGANSVVATLGVKVGDTTFMCEEAETATLTNTATEYTFTGSASGAITLSWANESAKAIYVKSIYVEYSTEPAWADIFADFTDQSFFTEADANGATAGLKMEATGGFTRVAADDATANAVISGKWHSNEHGISNFSATVKVEGAVRISFGTCAWGGDVTVKNAEGETVATMNTNTGACYHQDKQNNIVSCLYKQNVATTLTISGGSYVPYFAVEAVDPSQLVSDATVTFAAGEAEGAYVPEAVKQEVGKTITLPKNFTMYVEGKTLTAWSDGQQEYPVGSEYTVPDSDVTLTAVFTANEMSLADRDDAVTVKWNFRRDAGAPTVGWENKDGLVWVAQADVNGKTIDVALPFSTAPGKFANGNWTDWAQVNNGTTFHVPSCKGATISMEAYGTITTTTIDGQTDYTQGTTISYTIGGAAESVDVVIGDGSYYRYIQVVLPKVEQQQGGGESFDHVAGTINWPVGDELQPTISNEIAAAISSASVSTGSDLIIESAKYFDTDMVKYTPNASNAGNIEGVMVEYRVKPAAGVTFQPTQIDYAAVKVGTDNATYSWSYTVDGVESTITQIDPKPDLLRNNGANSVDNGGTAKLMHTETFNGVGECSEFTFRFYISACANNKNICIGNVTISGIVNGESVSVNMYTLATAAAPEEGGSVSVYPVAEQYEEGSEVTLTATENFGYDFVNWTNAAGEEVSTEAKFKYTVTADETLTANFVAVNTYELALTVDGTNDYMVTVSPEPTIVDGKWMYEEGQAVQLNANQYEGLVTFTNWSDGDTGSSKLISMTADVELTAMYAQADIIAGWDFYTAGGNGRKADFAAQDNDGDALNLVNTETGETSGWLDKSWLGAGGYESFKGAAVNWRAGSSNGDVGNWHWQTMINAQAFTDINVQFQMLYNYNAYQTYDAEYSLDGENWTKFGSITMTGAKQAVQFNGQLPAEANNQDKLYIRMLADKTSSVDGAASANDGNTLAMFFITGTPKLVNDGVAPVLVSTVPADGATGASATGKIVLTFDERVKLADSFVPTATLGNQTLTPVVSGKTVTFGYKGLEYGTQYTFTLPGGSIADLTDNFIESDITISFTTMERPSVDKKMYDAVVDNVDELMAAINAAEARADKNVRYRIFIKDGEYTIPVKSSSLVAKAEGYEVPECITFIRSGNISLIGESRDGVIITNGIDKNETFAGTYGTTSKYDGIGNSDVFQISGSDYYFQDLTIESGMADATGRDLAVHDKATRTIYKNTGLRGYQDTWTSNNDNGLYYFEGGYVRGRTDYMCGKGDAFFNGVELRQIAGGYAAVPSKSIKYGFVYKDCTINGEPAVVNYATGETRTAKQVDGNYTLGRPWGQGTPIALYIDTKMNVVPSAIGWNEMSGGWPKRFAEYNSMTATGSLVDLSGRKKTFGEGHENNPILTAEEALEAGNLHNMFGEWDPTLATEQAPIPTDVTLNVDTKDLTWANSDYALLWAIVKDGKVVDFTLEPAYVIDDTEATWAVRAANEMGGLSEASTTATITTAISEVANSEQAMPETIYNINGIRMVKAQNGLYIINGKKVVVK